MRLLLLSLSLGLLAFGDIQSVLSEANLEKRSDRALSNADTSLNEARKAYQAQDMKAFNESLKEVRESVELCYKSLQESGKVARRNPKYFKKAEMRLRDLARRLDNFEKDMMIEERPQVTALKKRVDELNEQIVLEIMTKK